MMERKQELEGGMGLNQQRAIRDVLRSMGLLGDSLSMRQLVCAVELAHQNPELLLRVTKGLYPAVAAHVDQATPSTVERNLRLIRDHQWDKGDQERLREMAGFPIRVKPTTGEFVDLICYYMEAKGAFDD